MTADPELVRHERSPRERQAMLRVIADAVRSLPGVRLAWAYGSFLRGEPFRDLDLAVQFVGPPGWRDPNRIAQAVWIALGRPPFDIDVVPTNDATPAFRWEVARSGVLLAESARGEATDFTALARSEIIDMAECRHSLAGRL
jgi:predicted nucleotidyltransferase